MSIFFFSSRRRHTRFKCDWSSDVCSSDLTTLSIFVLNITTLFGLGLGVDYSLFMVSRFREELARGHSVEEAVAITVATPGPALTFSGLPGPIGLIGLLFFPTHLLPPFALARLTTLLPTS